MQPSQLFKILESLPNCERKLVTNLKPDNLYETLAFFSLNHLFLSSLLSHEIQVYFTVLNKLLFQDIQALYYTHKIFIYNYIFVGTNPVVSKTFKCNFYNVYKSNLLMLLL